MSGINLSLDEIIAKNKGSKKGRGQDSSFKSDSINGRRNGGGARQGFRNGGGFPKGGVPSGKWRHDKFGGEEGAAGHGGLLSVAASNKKVRVNLSNLAPSVMTADLEELFGSYNIDTATVHYGESGEALGTGDVVLKKKDALRMFNDFKGVSVDGQKIQLVIVEGPSAGTGSVFDRVQVGGGIRRVSGGGIQKRPNSGGFRRSGGGGFSNPLDRMETGGAGGAGGRRGGPGGRRGGVKKAPQTEADLDAELDAYMKKKA